MMIFFNIIIKLVVKFNFMFNKNQINKTHRTQSNIKKIDDEEEIYPFW